jgi:hypothetical protein
MLFYIINCVPSKLVPTIPYELWNDTKPNLEHMQPWGSGGYIHNTSQKYGKLGPRANKHIFIRSSKSSKSYVMCGEHPNGGITEIKTHDVILIKNDFPSIGENLNLILKLPKIVGVTYLLVRVR